MTPKLKKIIVAIVVLGVIFVAWAVFLKPDPTNETLVSGRSAGAVGSSISSSDARILGSQISQALLRIQQIVLDRAIFENKVYKSLEDRNREIADEPTGRTNPFAPLGVDNINSTSRTEIEEDIIVPPPSNPATRTTTPPAVSTTPSSPSTSTPTSPSVQRTQ